MTNWEYAKSTGDRIVLAALLTFFAFSAFAMNPHGWGWFDTMAAALLGAAGLWQLVSGVILSNVRRKHAGDSQ